MPLKGPTMSGSDPTAVEGAGLGDDRDAVDGDLAAGVEDGGGVKARWSAKGRELGSGIGVGPGEVGGTDRPATVRGWRVGWRRPSTRRWTWRGVGVRRARADVGGWGCRKWVGGWSRGSGGRA